MFRPTCLALSWLLLLPLIGSAGAAEPIESEDLSGQDESSLSTMSFEELMELRVRVSVATKTEESTFNASGTVYVITEQDIRRYGWLNLREILRSLPSFDMRWDWLVINGGQRGSAAPLLLIDGRDPTALQSVKFPILSDFPASRIKQVEVLMGPNSTLYGGNAMGGVINIITKDGEFGDKDVSYVEYTRGQVGLEQVSGVFHRELGEATFGFGASHYVSHNDWTELRDFYFDDIRYSRSEIDPLRDHDPASFQNTEENFAVHFFGKYRSVYVGANYNQTSAFGIEAPRLNNRADPTENRQRLVFAGVHHRFSPNIDARLEYQNWLGRFDTNVILPTNAGVATSSEDLTYSLYAASLNEARHRIWSEFNFLYGPHHLVAGYDFWKMDLDVAEQNNAATPDVRRPLSSLGNRVLDITPQLHHSVFVQETLRLWGDLLKVTAGVSLTGETFAKATLLPRASIVVQPLTSLALKLTYGSAFRTGLPQELVAGEGLNAETLNMLELGLSQKTDRSAPFQVTHTAALFMIRSDNALRRVSEPGNPLGYRTENSPSSTVRGAEDQLRLGYRRWGGFFSLRFARPDLVEVAGSRIAQGIPMFRSKLGLLYGPWKYLTPSVFAEFASGVDVPARPADPDSPAELEVHRIPAYCVFNANLNIGEFTLSKMKVTAGLNVENVLNQVYYHPGNRSPIQYLQTPRTFRATLALEL